MRVCDSDLLVCASKTGSGMWLYMGKLIELKSKILREKKGGEGFFVVLTAKWASNHPRMLDLVRNIIEVLEQYFSSMATEAASEP